MWNGGEVVSVKDVVTRLNLLLKKDPDTVQRLVEKKVRASPELVQAPDMPILDGRGTPKLGVVDLLNAIFGVDLKGYGPVMPCYNENERLVSFSLPEESC